MLVNRSGKMDEYECVSRGKLKLKKDSDMKKKKKKKSKSKEKEKMEKVMIEKGDSSSNEAPVRQLTKAEISFRKKQEKMVRFLLEFKNFY